MAVLGVPDRFTIQHRKHPGIGGLVILHGARIGADKVTVGTALIEGNFRGESATCCQQRRQNAGGKAGQPHHSTVIAAVCTCVAPC